MRRRRAFGEQDDETIADEYDLTPADFEQLPKLAMKWKYSPTIGKGVVFIARFLVQTSGQVGLEATDKAKTLADMAARALHVDFKYISIRGVTIQPLPTPEEAGGPYSLYGVTIKEGAYLVDAVLETVKDQYGFSGPTLKVNEEAKSYITQHGMSNSTVWVIAYAPLNPFLSNDPSVTSKIYEFWKSRLFLYEWVPDELQMTDYFRNWRDAGKAPEDYWDRVAWGLGLADFPDWLLPMPYALPGGAAVPKTPTSADLSTLDLNKPVLMGISPIQIGVFALFGYLGYRAYAAWRRSSHGRS